jgi:ABC-2 type transport system permease protein
MSALTTALAITTRDLRRVRRQPSRLLGGIARPFVWLLLVATGYNAIAQLPSGMPYREFVYPGVLVMACLFGGALTAVSTVYDREFGMLRLMLASPAGSGAVLLGRTVSATVMGTTQALVVLAAAPFIVRPTPPQLLLALGALVVASAVSAVLGLLVASRLRSVENFAGIINVLLFPLLFLSGALYPAEQLPRPLALFASLNPVTHMVELVRRAFGQPAEYGFGLNVVVLVAWTVAAFLLATLLFDPEARLIGRPRPARAAGAT